MRDPVRTHHPSSDLFGRVSKSFCLLLTLTLIGSCNGPKSGSDHGESAGSASGAPADSNGGEGSENGKTTNPENPDGQASPEADAGEDGPQDEPGPSGGIKFDMSMPDHVPGEGQGDDCDCTERAKSIFLLGDNSQLFVYHPIENSFEELPKYDCDFPEKNQVHSLGVDRNSVAWVQLRPSGDIFRVETLNGNKCTHSGNVPGQAGITNAGMSFVEHPLDGRCEQLYLHSAEGDEWFERPDAGFLAVLNPEGSQSKQIGTINFNGGELTGTADGRLFALAGVPDAKLIEYNPKTAKVIKQVKLPDVDTSGAFAFAFWGGDFYFFTDTFANKDGAFVLTSKVTKLDYDGSGELSEHLEATPRRIVGAGVSICAPLDPPQ